MNEKSLYKLKIFITVCGILVFASVLIWLITGIGRARDVSDEQRLENLRRSVVNGAVMCYSVEGFYPDSIDYLKENYGLSYDENRYLVHYRYVSADIRPSVSVYDKNSGDAEI